MARTGKNIYKRKDGRFEGRYIASREENGKAKYAYIYGKTGHEVEARLVEVTRELKAKEMKGVTTFSDATAVWLEDRKGNITNASIDRYEYLMDKYILPVFGDKDISQVSMVQINTYLTELADNKKHGKSAVRGTTVENLRSLVGNVFAFVAKKERGILDIENPVKVEKVPYAPLSSDEIRRLVSCAKYNRSPEMLGVMLCLYTGLGTGEICALSWDNFETGRREITVRHTLYRLKNKEGDEKRTKLTVTEVRKSARRTVQYPKELDAYVAEFYKKGTVFLTREKNRYLEQRTFCNHLENILKSYNMLEMTLSRVKKTHEAGLADVRYLTDPFYEKEEGKKSQIQVRLDERWLIKEMENDLLPLRRIIGVSSKDMGTLMGISEEDYEAIEAGEAVMDWDMFLSFLFFFKYNSKTESVVDALGLYPNALKERIAIVSGER